MERKEIKGIINHSGTVCGICIDENGKVLLINTKRFNAESFLEIPGGMIEEGENPENALNRELEEEIGYSVAKLEEIKRFNTSVGLTNEEVILYMCGVVKTTRDHEYEVIKMDVSDFLSLERNHQLKDVKTIQAAQHLERIRSIHFEREYSNIISIWDIQDSLLQAYRAIFLTSQSVLFSVSVFIATSDKPYYALFILPIGLYILWLMFNLTRKRGYGVWFCQLQLLYIENGQFSFQGIFFTEFKQFMKLKNKEMRKLLLSNYPGNRFQNDSIRKGMDIQILGIFLFLWIMLIIVTLLIEYI